jgi:hypothetical protein
MAEIAFLVVNLKKNVKIVENWECEGSQVEIQPKWQSERWKLQQFSE